MGQEQVEKYTIMTSPRPNTIKKSFGSVFDNMLRIRTAKIKGKLKVNKKAIPKINYEDELYAHMRIMDPDLLNGLERQVEFCEGRKFAFDFCYKKLNIAIEIDGGQWMSGGGKHNTVEDYNKLNIAAIHGYLLLRFKTEMVKKDPLGCIKQIRELYDIQKAKRNIS